MMQTDHRTDLQRPSTSPCPARRIASAAVVCAVVEALFLRASVVPPRSCTLLPPALSVGPDHHDNPRTVAVSPQRKIDPRLGPASAERRAAPSDAPVRSHMLTRSRLSDLALPPPAA